MRPLLPLALLATGFGTAACATLDTRLTTAAQTPAGQLFCSLDGVVFAIADARLQGAVTVTNALASAVRADCAAAAAATGARQGLPVSPPAGGSAPVVTIPAASAAGVTRRDIGDGAIALD